MTPLVNKLVGEFQQKLKSSDPAVRQLAEAKLMVGSILWTSALMAASAGYLTGPGPEDRDERAKRLATGWRPNALHIGDKYFQLSRLDPLAAVLNSAAFVTEIVDNIDTEDFGKAMLMGFGQTVRLLADRSYIESFSDIMGFIMQPEQNATEFMRRMGGMFVPASAAWRTINRSDPFQREVDGFLDAVKQNLPGMSSDLPIRRDFLGQPMKSAEYAGVQWLSPFQVGTRKGDRLYEEINRLHQGGYSAAPMPGRHHVRQGKRLRMDGAEYSKFLDHYGTKTRINGKTLQDSLRGLVGSSGYQSMTDEQRADEIKYLASRYSKQAREEIFGGSPRLQNSFNTKSRGWEHLLGLSQ